MALSMDEQRILEEMERKLAEDDPLLARRLTAFGRPGISAILRTRRARVIVTLLALILIAAVSLALYALSPFRANVGRSNPSGASATHHMAQSVEFR